MYEIDDNEPQTNPSQDSGIQPGADAASGQGNYEPGTNPFQPEESQPHMSLEEALERVPKQISWVDLAKKHAPEDLKPLLAAGQNGEGTAQDGPGYLQHPKPLFDYEGWTPWQREANARMQTLFRGNVYDALAPNFSERFKPGFDPESIPPSANAAILGLNKKYVLPEVARNLVSPFSWMATAEDFMEHALGKKIWDRPDPDENDRWWLHNHD